MSKFKLIPKAAEETGYSQKAMRRKIEEGIWIEGEHYIKSPDGRIHINMENYEKWLLSNRQLG